MTTVPGYDAIVIGTGPSGATVARELTKRGKRVLILEWGKNDPIRGDMIQAASGIGIPGKGMLVTYDGVTVFRGIITGGSGIFYYGTAFTPPVGMFDKYGIDIREEVEEIRKELPTQPLDDSLVGPMATRLMESARDLGYDWNKLPKFIYQDKCRSDCWRCNYGCPYQAKWNARMFVDEARLKGAYLITGAKVTRILSSGKQVTGVEYQKQGRLLRVEAPQVILSAGGIGSPVILEASGIRGAGKDYFFDPLIAVMGPVEGISGGREVPMATGVHMEDEGYLMTDMTVPGALFRAFAAQVFRVPQMLSHRKTLTIMIKAKDQLGGYLTQNGGVRKRISREDKGKLKKGYERAEEILKNAGARKVYKSWYIAAHPGGTIKIGEMVDKSLQTEVNNLYVCDCSVVPEVWGLPPTFTLVALGKRLAKHLTAEA